MDSRISSVLVLKYLSQYLHLHNTQTQSFVIIMSSDNPLRDLGGDQKTVHSDNIIQSEPPLVKSLIDISVKVPWKCSRIKVLKTTTDHVVGYNSRDLSMSRAICALSYSFLYQKKKLGAGYHVSIAHFIDLPGLF